MKRLRDPNWFLIVVFAAILISIPLVQTIKEIGSDDGVIALELFNESPTAPHLRNFEKKLEETSWAGHLSRPLVQFANFKWLKYGGEKAVVADSGWYFFKPGLAYMLARPEITPGAKATNDPVAAIVHFRDQLEAHGIHLLLMPVPNKDSIYPDRLTSRASDLRTVIAPRTREVLEKLRAANIEIVDLFRAFTDARQQSSAGDAPLYLAQDTHWSPRGVDLATKAAAHRLAELGWIKKGEVLYRGRPAPVQRVGDILHMLQAPRIEQSVAPETVATVQIVQGEKNEPYHDDPNAEVLVMGDSFMRIYQQDQPTAAGFIAHLAKELKQTVFSIVNDGGGATLVREELASRAILLKNKKVVLWEFVERDIGLAIKGWPRILLPPGSEKSVASTQDR
jgi:hypothetical protein